MKDDNYVVVISLAIVSGILGILLVALLVFHVFQSRSYNRQISVYTQEAFDPTIFNKKALPNTNIHAKEKSNPVMNADPQNIFYSDTRSIISTDSDDFAGLENNPIFDISSKVNDNLKNPLSAAANNKDSFA